jgi:hypothetical protein
MEQNALKNVKYYWIANFFCYGTLDDQKFIQAMQFLNCMIIKYIAMIHDMASLYNKNTGS